MSLNILGISAHFRALDQALDAYQDREGWRRLMLNGMAKDYSWEVQAREYVELYRRFAA